MRAIDVADRIGCWLTPAGAFFRVWAPHAEDFGGWDGAGNAFHEPSTQPDGRVYVNVPKWSVTVFRSG